MSIIVVQDEAELKQKFIEAVYIMRMMRKKQKVWHQYYGAELKADREHWEAKADAFLETIVLLQPDQRNSHTITIKEPEKQKV